MSEFQSLPSKYKAIDFVKSGSGDQLPARYGSVPGVHRHPDRGETSPNFERIAYIRDELFEEDMLRNLAPVLQGEEGWEIANHFAERLGLTPFIDSLEIIPMIDTQKQKQVIFGYNFVLRNNKNEPMVCLIIDQANGIRLTGRAIDGERKIDSKQAMWALEWLRVEMEARYEIGENGIMEKFRAKMAEEMCRAEAGQGKLDWNECYDAFIAISQNLYTHSGQLELLIGRRESMSQRNRELAEELGSEELIEFKLKDMARRNARDGLIREEYNRQNILVWKFLEKNKPFSIIRLAQTRHTLSLPEYERRFPMGFTEEVGYLEEILGPDFLRFLSHYMDSYCFHRSGEFSLIMGSKEQAQTMGKQTLKAEVDKALITMEAIDEQARQYPGIGLPEQAIALKHRLADFFMDQEQIRSKKAGKEMDLEIIGTIRGLF